MQINDYIKGLRLQITDLKKKKNNYLQTIDKNFKNSQCNPEFDKMMKKKEKINDTENKLEFAFKLREEMKKNETNRQRYKKHT